MPDDPTSAEKLNVGLLLCDDVPDDGRERFGDYTGMFKRGFDTVDRAVEITAFDAYRGELPRDPQDADGYLISGSSASVFEDKQWIRDLMEFVQQCYKQRVKTVGICFGHQLIAHALGGETVRSENGWGFGIHQSQIMRRPQWMQTGPDQFKLVVIHQDQVVKLPSGFSTLASNDFCPHSVISDNGAMLGIQGHPEFSKDYCAYRADFRRSLIGESKYQESVEQLAANELDSKQVFSWISRFLRND